VIDPAICPIPPEIKQLGVPMLGIMAAVQEVAVDSNPDPVYVNTEPLDPVAGVTLMLAVTLNGAHTVCRFWYVPRISFAGVPTTVTLYAMFVVAYGPTTKLPCAV
jgi:hypothetical protein